MAKVTASLDAQRFCSSVSGNWVLAVSKINELRRDFAWQCMEAFDKDDSFDYEAALAKHHAEIQAVLRQLEEDDEYVINRFLTIKSEKH